MTMIKVEPTGVLFVGVCDIQTEKCTARTAAPVTAVWPLPAREQINVCRSCLDEMVRRGEWQVEGARLRRRADVAVFDHAGNLQLVVEAKQAKPGEDTSKRAIQIRRNLLVHAGIPQTPFFLIAFPDHSYLWRRAFPDEYDRPADYHIDAQDIIQSYAKRHTTSIESLSGLEFEQLVSEWINDLINSEDESHMPEWVKSSGLYQAIKDGATVQEAAV